MFYKGQFCKDGAGLDSNFNKSRRVYMELSDEVASICAMV